METSRYTTYPFRNGKTARNRVVVPPMASQTADEKGFATEKTVTHYARLAESGAGLIFVEYTFVNVRGQGEPNQLAADADDKIPGLAAIARTLHKAGALAGLQLVHVGGKSAPGLTGLPLQQRWFVRQPEERSCGGSSSGPTR